jgi:hypothetical protein
MEFIQNRAERALARAHALGLTGRNGKPLVLDQVLELIAAEDGFRNRHALIADARKKASTPKALDTRPGFMQEIDHARDNFKRWPKWMQETAHMASARLPAEPVGTWVICAPSERDPDGHEAAADTGFWSNEHGWGSRALATTFTGDEKARFHLPLASGRDARWLAFDAPPPCAPEKLECVGCGLPTQVGDDGLCNQCYAHRESQAQARSLADEAYERYDFGPDVRVEDASGWLSDGCVFSRPVFVRFSYDAPDRASTAVDFRVVVEDGAVQSIRALVRDTGEPLGRAS